MHFKSLISAPELKKIINDPSLRLFDCRFYLTEPDKGLLKFEQGHIPNSQYADLNNQLAGPILANTGRHPLPDKSVFENQLREWGVDENSQVVVYDDASGAIAARLWWMCLWAGIKNVAVLDGGIQAWINHNNELKTNKIEFPKSNFSASYNDNLWVSTQDIELLSTQSNLLLIDARANARYQGEHEPIDPIAGHIPNATNFSFDQNLNREGLFLNKDQLINQHQQPDGIEQVISMCGSGVTACHNMLARTHAGLDMGKLYVGSWSEWIVDSKRPISKI